jgi:thiol-disulfide isomerase/thioredoxin
MRLKLLKLVPILFFAFQLANGLGKDNTLQKMNFQQFENHLRRQSDTVYVVNFWASWCKPCCEELPAFEKITDKYAGKKVKVLLVSLDFPIQLESRLLPYIQKNGIKSEVILLDDPNQNLWIDKVYPKWSGAIPFTQIYGKGFRDSYERSFRFNELDSIINFKLNKP